MMRSRITKVVAAVAVVAFAGVSGATWAASQDGGGGAAGPAGVAVQPADVNTSIPRERHFVPVTACRAVDTRDAGGILAAGTSRGFDIFGTNLSGQGGSDTGCGIPTYADTVAMNLISTQPTGTGFLRGSAQNLALFDPVAPTATLLSFATGPNRSNEVPLQMCRPGGLLACSGGDEIRLWAFSASTHVVVDVLGYYVTPVFITAQGDGDTVENLRSNGVTAVARVSEGVYQVTVDRDLRGCALNASAGNSGDEFPATRFATGSSNATDMFIRTYDATGTLSDSDFSVVASC